MPFSLKTVKAPSDESALTNCAIVSDKRPEFAQVQHIRIKLINGYVFFSLRKDPALKPNEIAFSGPHRKWLSVSFNMDIEIEPHKPSSGEYITSIVLTTDFINKKKETRDPFDTDRMAVDFNAQFPGQIFMQGQPLAFQFSEKPKTTLSLFVKEIECLDDKTQKAVRRNQGVLTGASVIIFDRSEESTIVLVGKSKAKPKFQSVINPEWDFTNMGIGGLDDEFNQIFRRAFASRVFPPEVIESLGLKHCRGILLFGPPGTGKTLMARTIGTMLNAREPKIVNGPQILDKYVGESEANIRKLFAEAEEEEKRAGIHSGLHIIIFDEIDAICKQRGSMAGSTAVHDTVVNQLLAKIDGVDQLNNILVIGMTNRRDMIDDALLRPGRLEIQMEIGLPKEDGRLQILNIHTNHLKSNGKLASDVDLAELATLTKNFSGAELAGLVRAATSTAMNRLIKVKSKVEIDPNAVDKLQVCRSDFLLALDTDVKPAFGLNEEELDHYLTNGIHNWGEPVTDLLNQAALLVSQIKSSNQTKVLSVLLEGPPSSGKTALAVQIAKNSNLPYLKICAPDKFIGQHEAAKCLAIKKMFDDAYKSPMSCIIVDDIEGLIDYVNVGPRFSNLVLQELRVLLTKAPPHNRKLLIIATTSEKEVLRELGLLSRFSNTLHCYNLRRSEEVYSALDSLSIFSSSERERVLHGLKGKRVSIGIRQLIFMAEMANQVQSGQEGTEFLVLLEQDNFILDDAFS